MTRRRKRAIAVRMKKRKEIRLAKDPPPLPYKVQLMLKAKGLLETPPPLRDPDTLPFPEDDVYFARDFTFKRWTLEAALEELKLLNHPSLSTYKRGTKKNLQIPYLSSS